MTVDLARAAEAAERILAPYWHPEFQPVDALRDALIAAAPFLQEGE